MSSYDDTATVSGSVVSFSDGADEVGLKSCVVSLPASLSGYSEVNAVQTGKNLLNPTYLEDGYSLGANGLPTLVAKRIATTTAVPIHGGNITISYSTSVNTVQFMYATFVNGALIERVAGKANGSTINAQNADEIYISLYDTQSSDITGGSIVTNVQIEYGSTATSYEAYEAPTQYTASLGTTIHGGTVDLATGTGADSSKTVKLSAFTWEYVTGEYSYGYFVRSGNVADMATNKNFQATGYINNGNPRSSIGNGEIGVYNNANAIRRPVIRDDSCTSLEQFLEKIADYDFVYECTNTPTSFTFTPVSIETSKGSNTFWSDQGDTELTYYKDGYGFTSVTIHKETPDGEPVEETRKLHRIIYEGQVDVISGTGLIYRGESGTQYDPPEQISFTPIEIATDEGENTLYADDGDSAITYRKAVE